MPFHPTINEWFNARYPQPTEVQKASWPVIAAGKHTLITAPTGSGKTLTAFMWSLHQFACGAYARGRTKVLYISPLKALNNDIQRNLLEPVAELQQQYGFCELKIQTRSGDTTQSDRQRMLRQPPDILITTPESLHLLLTTTKGRQALSQVETLILDEIHALVDNRRGAQLMANVERLVDLCGECQRIALSATVAPLSEVAAYVAGCDAQHHERRVEIIDTPGNKQIDFRVRFPREAKAAADNGQKIWDPLSHTFRDVISANKATLFFTNSRRLAEKITLKVNEEQAEPLAYAHHGSLAREVRSVVEGRLKNGELKAIVATNSLEMGIDVGHLDEVVMVQSPPSVAATLQRIGRAGHSVGEVSHGTLFPTHAHDFLAAAVLAGAINDRDIEPLHLMQAPLDVLAQIIISICATDPWPVANVYALITRARPYRNLSQENFDSVVEMLAGRYAGSRIRELKPRLVYDRIEQTIKATRGALLAMYNSGGSIPDRGYYQLKHVDSGATLGELDEEFVWEATVGQTFAFGTQHWQIHRITHNDVMVRPALKNSSAPPFWRSEFFNRSFHFSNRITEYLETVEAQLATQHSTELTAELQTECGFEENAATELVDYLQRQRAHTETALPHRHHVVAEWIKAGPAGYRGPDNPQQLVLHTFWGGRLNQPWALALGAAWQKSSGTKLEIHADNDAIVMQLKQEIDVHALMTSVSPATLLDLLRDSLEQSGFFGARFRECAGRSLLLTKQRFNQRLPLWMSRLQAKKLMGQIKKLQEFPVLLETWRTCLDDEFDIPALSERLAELADGRIHWSLVDTSTPSPFAHNLTFGQVSRYMYADDTPESDEPSNLSIDAISQALHNDALRPQIDDTVIELFEAKRQRRLAGYEPLSEEEWSEWLKERVLIPVAELPEEWPAYSFARHVAWHDREWVCHAENEYVLYHSGLLPAKAPATALNLDDARDVFTLSRQILSFYGPRTEAQLASVLPSIADDVLCIDENFIHGQLRTDNLNYWCDAENFEILMRFQRAARRADFTALSSKQLPVYWSQLHKLGVGHDPQAWLFALECLRGYPTHVSTWLNDLLAARLDDASVARFDAALSRYGLAWQGVGREMISIGYPEELEMLRPTMPEPAFASAFTDRRARYGFDQVAEQSGLDRSSLNQQWWQAVWNGQLSSDALTPLAEGLLRKFAIEDLHQVTSSRRRLARAPRSWTGNWQLTLSVAEEDALTALEADKERVRLILDRYGLINRDIVNREHLPGREHGKPWRWREAFNALRLMELAGEVSMGHFFEDLTTPQFITPSALGQLQRVTTGADKSIFWLAANDPAAPCGLSLPWEELPQRRAGNYLVFQGGELALVVEHYAKTLTYHCPPEHNDIAAVNEVLKHLLDSRRERLNIHTINQLPARQSPYLAALEREFDTVADHKQVSLEQRF